MVEIEKTVSLKVGKLGKRKFSPGFFIYVGSAQRNLRKRIERHFKKEKKTHWHIDYLLQVGKIKGCIILAEYPKEKECQIAQLLQQKFSPLPGFGSSDCNCLSHLFYMGR